MKNIFFRTVVLGLFILSEACQENHFRNHPEYLEEILRVVDSTDDNQKELAFSKMDSVFRLLKQPGVRDYFECYNRKRDFYFSVRKDYERAMLYADSTIAVLKTRLDDNSIAMEYASALFLKGDICFAQKDFDEGMYYYSTAKVFAGAHLKDSCVGTGYNGRLGFVFFEQGKYLQAAKFFRADYYDRLACEANKFMKFVYMQNNLANIGYCFSKAGMPDSARFYFEKALYFIRVQENSFPKDKAYIQLAKAVVYARQAQLLVNEKKFPEAENILTKSIALTRSDYLEFTQQSMLDLAVMYLDTRKTSKAGKMLAGRNLAGQPSNRICFNGVLQGKGRFTGCIPFTHKSRKIPPPVHQPERFHRSKKQKIHGNRCCPEF
ncbi:tetratricopeptide repeat protein [Foetidibacter luteolus]|uniref:tetratricopeptide repeat protein n=1 Tax=Foetidibacter luteolus TaxID=2608880 RepID=UPI001A986FE8|nr:hypothetical protein [Foetidibacter luteolus]